MPAPTFYSYPRGEDVPAQLAFDVLLDRRYSREDFMHNVASVHPVRMGPADPVWIEWATTNTFAMLFDPLQTRVEYAKASAGEDDIAASPPLPPQVIQQAQRSRAHIAHLAGEAPYLNLVAMQRGLHAERELSTAGELHRDVELELAREIGIVSHFMNGVNVAACARHGLDAQRWGLRVLDHSKLPLDFYDHMVEVIAEQEQPLGAAERAYLDNEIGWFQLQVNHEHLLPDWMFHEGGGYLSAAERAAIAPDAIGHALAWNAELHFRRSYVCPLSQNIKARDRAWLNPGPVLGGAAY